MNTTSAPFQHIHIELELHLFYFLPCTLYTGNCYLYYHRWNVLLRPGINTCTSTSTNTNKHRGGLRQRTSERLGAWREWSTAGLGSHDFSRAQKFFTATKPQLVALSEKQCTVKRSGDVVVGRAASWNGA
jgi:hypothetical protein